MDKASSKEYVSNGVLIVDVVKVCEQSPFCVIFEITYCFCQPFEAVIQTYSSHPRGWFRYLTTSKKEVSSYIFLAKFDVVKSNDNGSSPQFYVISIFIIGQLS